jgi:hypothetical protein
MPMRVGLAATVGFILAAAAFAAAGREVVGPQRIVSMNLCADELVLRLGAPGTVR